MFRWMERWVAVWFVVGLGSACGSADTPSRCIPNVTCPNQTPMLGGSGGNMSMGLPISAGNSAAGAPGGPIAGGGVNPSGMAGVGVGAAGTAVGTAGIGTAGAPTTPVGGAGTPGTMMMAGAGSPSMPMGGTGTAGSTMAGTGMAGAAGSTTAGSGGMPGAGGEFEAVRQVCVDTINMYRMTRGLMPLVRATAAQETCSDGGAKMDGDSGRAHGSAGMCQLGSQNSCPGYSLRVGGGTIEGTLKFCLQQMWDEGEPAEGVAACKADRSGCYQEHGHWINMVEPNIRTVGCGFYKMANGSYWMNQNFGR